MTITSNRRRYPRLNKTFETRVRVLHRSAESSGITYNLSQNGAFIINSSWSDYQVDDQSEIIFLLPPDFTGQKHTLMLKGQGIVRRVDGDRWGIAVEFLRELKRFEVCGLDEL